MYKYFDTKSRFIDNLACYNRPIVKMKDKSNKFDYFCNVFKKPNV